MHMHAHGHAHGNLIFLKIFFKILPEIYENHYLNVLIDFNQIIVSKKSNLSDFHDFRLKTVCF